MSPSAKSIIQIRQNHCILILLASWLRSTILCHPPIVRSCSVGIIVSADLLRDGHSLSRSITRKGNGFWQFSLESYGLGYDDCLRSNRCNYQPGYWSRDRWHVIATEPLETIGRQLHNILQYCPWPFPIFICCYTDYLRNIDCKKIKTW